MPIHIGRIDSEVTALDAELPLTEAQLDKLARRVVERIRRHDRDAAQTRQLQALPGTGRNGGARRPSAGRSGR